MKFLSVIILSLSFNSFAQIEKIQIVKPLVNVETVTIGSTIYQSNLQTSGSFSQTLKSKAECIKWVTDAIEKLKSANKTIFSAECDNEGSWDDVREDGSFSGKVSYL